MEAMDMSMQARAVSQRTLIVAVVIAAAIGLTAGLLLAPDALGTPEGEGKEVQSPKTAGPRSVENGVPVGYARTEEGAVLAATNFSLVSTSELVRDRQALIRAVETFAAPSWREEARRQAENAHEFAVNRYGDDVEATTSVVRYETRSFSEEAASVRLWAVTVAGGSNRPQEAIWATSILDLEWIEGDWRVSGGDSQEGPVPTSLQDPSDAESLIKLIGESRDFTEGPRP
jgi:hypothetical protein